MTHSILVFVLCLSVFADPVVGYFHLHPRVVNGQTMEYGEWPFLVSMHFLKPNDFTIRTQMKHVCGGTLIDRKWVLTAAHCVGLMDWSKKTEDWEIVLGEHNQYLKDVGEQIIKPVAFFPHPGYRPMQTYNLFNDIALVKLEKEAELTEYVNLTSITNQTDLIDQTACKIGGWGQVSSDPYGWGMYIPLKATVFVINNRTCSDAFLRIPFFEVDDSVVCAGLPKSKQTTLQQEEEDANDACQGDSGSPLMCATGNRGEYQLTGVASAGKGCGTGKYPGLYTRIAYYQDWIQSVMENN